MHDCDHNGLSIDNAIVDHIGKATHDSSPDVLVNCSMHLRGSVNALKGCLDLSDQFHSESLSLLIVPSLCGGKFRLGFR